MSVMSLMNLRKRINFLNWLNLEVVFFLIMLNWLGEISDQFKVTCLPSVRLLVIIIWRLFCTDHSGGWQSNSFMKHPTTLDFI